MRASPDDRLPTDDTLVLPLSASCRCGTEHPRVMSLREKRKLGLIWIEYYY
ncbi:MAG: hypothetical protein KJP15_09370 [Gammaproteobacteria bacterium]|nr:hypothetical protein [Gammaproteobacteria bacterium]